MIGGSVRRLGMRYPSNDAQFIGICDGTSRAMQRPEYIHDAQLRIGE
jgi:hypothetical protein